MFCQDTLRWAPYLPGQYGEAAESQVKNAYNNKSSNQTAQPWLVLEPNVYLS